MEMSQWSKITGYRQLRDEEVALMNEAKALAEEVGRFVAKLRGYPTTQLDGVPRMHETLGGEPKALPSLDQRWVSIGATDIQKGFMALSRAIAQPTTF